MLIAPHSVPFPTRVAPGPACRRVLLTHTHTRNHLAAAAAAAGVAVAVAAANVNTLAHTQHTYAPRLQTRKTSKTQPATTAAAPSPCTVHANVTDQAAVDWFWERAAANSSEQQRQRQQSVQLSTFPCQLRSGNDTVVTVSRRHRRHLCVAVLLASAPANCVARHSAAHPRYPPRPIHQ